MFRLYIYYVNDTFLKGYEVFIEIIDTRQSFFKTSKLMEIIGSDTISYFSIEAFCHNYKYPDKYLYRPLINQPNYNLQ